jgi:hypothetical protein
MFTGGRHSFLDAVNLRAFPQIVAIFLANENAFLLNLCRVTQLLHLSAIFFCCSLETPT